jgi:alcohol/geraniol dehydrogenase (NADP+)
MPALTITGYAARERGGPLEPFTYEAPALGDQDVRVSVTHCGVCYSDVHAIEGRYGVFKFPLVPGHEIVGNVSEVGRAVTGLKEGDRVGIGWQGRSCMRCEWCQQREEQLCLDVVNNGTWTPYGGFSSSVVVDGRFAYLLPGTMPSEAAAVLMCAGIAVYSPLRTYAAGGSTRVGVVGVGGLGHLAIQFAHGFGCEVTAISSSPQKEQEARAFGADRFIASGDRAGMDAAESAFDLLLCSAPAGVDWDSLTTTLRRRGRLVLLGFPQLAMDSVDLVVHELSVTGSFPGSRSRMQEMLEFAQERNIVPKVELMPMSQVREAIQRVRENQARYRIVLVNDRVV